MMKVFALCVTFLAVAVATATAAAPVLEINGVPVSAAEFEMTRQATAAMMGDRAKDPDAVTRQAVDQLVTRVLLAEVARKAGVEVSPDAVKARLSERITKGGGEKAWQSFLESSGITAAEMNRLETERALIEAWVKEKVLPEVRVDEAAARTYYDDHPDEFQHPEQVRLAMIHMETAAGAGADDQAAAEARAQRALSRIKAGEDFGTVARELSDDRSRAQGGEVGWVRKGMLYPDLEQAVWGMDVGSVSPILKRANGLYIFKVEGRRPAGVMPWDEVKATLPSYLTNTRVQQRLAETVASARAAATIVGRTPAVEKALAPAADARP